MHYEGMEEDKRLVSVTPDCEKERSTMNADIKWLDNPEIFRVNQLDAHSDHSYYVDYADMKKRIILYRSR